MKLHLTPNFVRRRISSVRLITKHRLWLPLLLFLAAAGAYLLLQPEAPAGEGYQNTHGIVTDLKKNEIAGEPDAARYLVRFRFETSGKVTVSGAQQVTARFFAQLKKGGPIRVSYLESNPAIQQINPDFVTPFALTPPIVSILMVLVASGFTIWFAPQAFSAWRASHYGAVRQARVVRQESTSWISNGITLSGMVWTDSTGVTGNSKTGTFDRFMKTGTRIIVYIDPKTGRAWWEDDL